MNLELERIPRPNTFRERIPDGTERLQGVERHDFEHNGIPVTFLAVQHQQETFDANPDFFRGAVESPATTVVILERAPYLEGQYDEARMRAEYDDACASVKRWLGTLPPTFPDFEEVAQEARNGTASRFFASIESALWNAAKMLAVADPARNFTSSTKLMMIQQDLQEAKESLASTAFLAALLAGMGTIGSIVSSCMERTTRGGIDRRTVLKGVGAAGVSLGSLQTGTAVGESRAIDREPFPHRDTHGATVFNWSDLRDVILAGGIDAETRRMSGSTGGTPGRLLVVYGAAHYKATRAYLEDHAWERRIREYAYRSTEFATLLPDATDPVEHYVASPSPLEPQWRRID